MINFSRKFFRPIYQKIHYLLHLTLHFNPFIRKKIHGRRITIGHIRMEQEINPLLDSTIVKELIKHCIDIAPYTIDAGKFNQYLLEVKYPSEYFNNGIVKSDSFIEKALEHFVSIELLQPNNAKTIIDIGAANSPFYNIIRNHYDVNNSYAQDLIYLDELNNFLIGGNASKLPFESNSIDGITLHCTLEHFEGTNDIGFFIEAERILKPGGVCIVLPLYLASEYTINLDPISNMLKCYRPNIKEDMHAQFRYGNSNQHFSRHYDVKTFKRRILEQVNLKTEILHVVNYKNINSKSYLRFIGVFTKI